MNKLKLTGGGYCEDKVSSSENSELRFIDFFAGIGGFRKGMELAGHKCVGFCEFDKFAVASYTSMHLLTEEQREYLNTLSVKKRLNEILKDEYRNGEWYASDIREVHSEQLPESECWCFGAPCQDFSVAGKRAGMDGDRSSLIREIFRLLEEQKEEDRPEWLIYENVKGMLSSNKGLDYLSILSEMDRLGYDIEWQNINSKWFVPQNRERVYSIGHLRRFGFRKVFPVTGADRENSVSVIAHRERYRRNLQTFSSNGITEALDTGQCGGRGHHVAIPIQCCRTKGIVGEPNYSHTLMARDYKGIGNQEMTAVAIPVLTPGRAGRGVAQTLDISCNQGTSIILTDDKPDITDKNNGIYVEMPERFMVYAIWYEKEQCYIAIRRLTPKECFRLQGWTDDYFEKAAFVNSDSQLYKQAGNGVTVSVVEAIANKM